MRVTRAKIRTLFGLKELELGGGDYLLTGKNGAGKSSGLDSLRLALTNRSPRSIAVHQGADEGEIIIETDTGLAIDRKIRTSQAPYSKITNNGQSVQRPETFISSIFTPLQLNPIEFMSKSADEQNREILSLVKFNWDMNWIADKFGEIPPGVNYEQHILKVLDDIQSERGVYYKTRQDYNSQALHKRKTVEDIAATIPAGYSYEKWDNYSLSEKYAELEKKKDRNGKIERAKAFQEAYDNKKRGIEATRMTAVSAAEKSVQNERQGLLSTIERLKAEIKAAEDKMAGLDAKLADKTAIADAQYKEALAKLDADTGIANEWADKEPEPISELQEEINTAEAMKKHLNEYQRMIRTQSDVDELTDKSEDLTAKITLARKLPGEILQNADLPIEGLSVVDGKPLINGRPIDNLSGGEKLMLCVDIAASKCTSLNMILIDDVNNLTKEMQEKLFAKCKEKGVQFIASATSEDESELTVVEL